MEKLINYVEGLEKAYALIDDNSDVERISMSFNVDNLYVDNKPIEMDYDIDWLVIE